MYTLIAFIIIIIIIATSAYAGIIGAPWVPTKKIDRQRIVKLADIKSGEKFYDLGCGTGGLLKIASQKGAQAIGYEIALLPYIIAKLRFIFNKNIKIKYKNFYKADLSEADIVYLFLMPSHYQKVVEQFEQQLKKNTKVIIYVWPIAAWDPVKVDKAEKRPTLYLYEI